VNEAQERTEAATPKKLARARAQGQNPYSALAVAAFTVSATALPFAAVPAGMRTWVFMFRRTVGAAAVASRDHDVAALFAALHVAWSLRDLWIVAGLAALASWLAATMIAAACGALGYSPGALRPTWRRLAWSAGVAQLLPRGAPMQVIMIAVCIAALGWAAEPCVASLIGAAMLGAPFPESAAALGEALKTSWQRAAISLGIVALADVVIQRRRFAANLKMSMRELRDERAEAEGRPEVKSRRRSLATRVRAVDISAVRRATAVVTNPTHLAIALRYAPPGIDVPIVVSRGADLAAHAVRAAAERYAVPIVESPDLARTLYARAEHGAPIPEECYAAVAAIFIWIVRTRGSLAGAETDA